LMYTDFQTASPDTPFKQIEEAMIRRTQRFLPVTEKGKVVGAITRTDLLRVLHDDILNKPGIVEEARAREEAFARNIANLMKDRLPAETFELLKSLGGTADEMGFSAYAVGGFVRDLLTGTENFDLDVVVEGQGIKFAQAVAKKLGGRVRAHQKFGTAVVVQPDGRKFDIATARTEYYEYPAALPTVELGSIKKDLYRRDFTINALAIRINEKGFGDLIDFFGGQRDIKENTIRVLHNLSLIEDPTRAFRAIRFEVRMGFTISRHTQNLIKNAVKMELFHRLAGGRIYTELALIFKETAPLPTLKRLDDFGLLRFIHPRLKFTKELEAMVSAISEALAWFRLLFLDVEADAWLVYFMGIFDMAPEKEVEELGKRLTIPERYMIKLRLARREGGRVLAEFYRNPQMRPYQVYRLLEHLPVEVLLFMTAKAKTEKAKKNISLHLTQYRGMETLVTGRDLQKMGLPPGPMYKKVLDALLEAKMDGELETRGDEEKYVRKYIKASGTAKVTKSAAAAKKGARGGA
ncbi:MAG TPA: CBS domain-containing protein, partial [Nitrospirota bacterium]|nr:CBS domain-containing protein [Nitrospirota bacterium]